MIARALQLGAFHMILPDHSQVLLDSLEGKKGKHNNRLYDILKTLEEDTLKFARVIDYPSKAHGGNFRYYSFDLEIDEFLNDVVQKEVEDINESVITKKARKNDPCPSTPKQTESAYTGRYLPPVTPEKEKTKRKHDGDSSASVETPKKGTSYEHSILC